MVKLDKIDLKLLSELERDARQTASQIGKRIGTSQQVVSYRISSLEKRGIISEYYTIINLTNLGYASYRTMIRLSSINKEKHKEKAKILTGKDNLYSINFPKSFVKPLRTKNHEAPCRLVGRGEVRFVRKPHAKIC